METEVIPLKKKKNLQITFNTLDVCKGLHLWVPRHRGVHACRKREHLDNGFVSFLTCWDALQRKRNYSLTAGGGPHKGLIIRGWWSEHVAHDQEKQWRWKVIKVPHRVEPCKLRSQLAATPLLDFLLFYYSPSPFPSSVLLYFLSHPAAPFLPFVSLLTLCRLPLDSCLAFLFMCPSFLQPLSALKCLSIHHLLIHECSSYLLCAKRSE